ncbi:hypothetical protein TKK_0016145 [Trichogramma kaykai]
MCLHTEGASIRSISAATDVKETSVFRMLKSVNLKPLKSHKVQKLLPADLASRRQFCEWGLNRLNDDPNFFANVCFTDESSFISNGVRNQQTQRKWAFETLHWINERNHYLDFKIMTWIGIINEEFIGPYFFEVNITGRLYAGFLRRVTLPRLREVNPDAWWQQVESPPPANVAEFTRFIEEECRQFPRESIRRATSSMKRRMTLCLQENGGHFQQFLKTRRERDQN